MPFAFGFYVVFICLVLIMLILDRSFEMVLILCSGTFVCLERFLRLCQAPSSIRVRNWSSLGKIATGSVSLGFLF